MNKQKSNLDQAATGLGPPVKKSIGKVSTAVNAETKNVPLPEKSVDQVVADMFSIINDHLRELGIIV